MTVRCIFFAENFSGIVTAGLAGNSPLTFTDFETGPELTDAQGSAAAVDVAVGDGVPDAEQPARSSSETAVAGTRRRRLRTRGFLFVEGRGP